LQCKDLIEKGLAAVVACAGAVGLLVVAQLDVRVQGSSSSSTAAATRECQPSSCSRKHRGRPRQYLTHASGGCWYDRCSLEGLTGQSDGQVCANVL
jgi:hypothetical protein